MAKEITLEGLIARMRRIRDEFEQMVRDAQRWNRLHPDETPLSTTFDEQSASLASDVVAAYERGDTRGPETAKLIEHLKGRPA